jgi:broad specificity phosphatase PhoE
MIRRSVSQIVPKRTCSGSHRLRKVAIPETSEDGRASSRIVTIHLVRHGETDWNVEHRLQGWTDIPLNATGVRQARSAARALAGRDIGALISSDLSRARDTAELIAVETGVEVVIDPALRERNYGVAEGRLNSELEVQFDDALDERWADPDFTFAGGETRREVYLRLGAFLTELLASPPQHEIVLVSHGGAMRVARGFLEGLPVERLPRWSFDNGEIVTVEVSRS